MIDATANKFIGQGIVFPIKLNVHGRPDIVSGKTLVEAALRDLFAWYLGTKYFLGEYGGVLEKLLQEPNSVTIQALVKHFTVDLVTKWEPRVELLDSSFVSKEEGVLYIQLKYRIKNTKIEGSFIYPYYAQLTF